MGGFEPPKPNGASFTDSRGSPTPQHRHKQNTVCFFYVEKINMLHVSLTGPKGFEPSTSSVTSSRSNQLELRPQVIVHQPEFESGRTAYQTVML